MREEIVVLDDMIEEFDRTQPNEGRETTAFIKRWRKKECEREHKSHHHLHTALFLINRAEIKTIRETKKIRDAPRRQE